MTKRSRTTPAPSSTPPEDAPAAAQTPEALKLDTPEVPGPSENPDSPPTDDTQTPEPEPRPYEEWGREFGVKAWELAAVKTKQRWPAGQVVRRQDFREALRATRKEVIES